MTAAAPRPVRPLPRECTHARVIGHVWLLCLIGMLCLAMTPAPVRAGVADAPPGQLEVSLITYGPGEVYWERFGHDAIQIRDRDSGEAVNFNYGVFDFDQDHFLLNFARGRMSYSMDADLAGPEMDWYARNGRSVQRQRLALTAAQAGALRDALLVNLRPGNRRYAYDYFTRNCATRVRDVLNVALGGVLAEQLDTPAGGITFRNETRRLMAHQPWLMLLLDLGLGGYADQPLSQWQAAFIPMRLMHDIRQVQLPDSRPLVTDEQQIAPSHVTPPPRQAPSLWLPLLLAGMVWGATMAIAGRYRPQRGARLLLAGTGTLWLLFAGLAGLFMAILWAFTQHRSAWANENLFLFNPLALGLIPAVWRRRPRRGSRLLAGVLAVSAIAGLAVKLLPGFDQQNVAWIALALPAWAGLVWAMGYRSHDTDRR